MLSHWHTAWSQPLSHALPRLRSAHHIVLAKPRCRPIKANGSITQPNPDDEGDEREHLSCVATGLDAVTCFVDDGPEEATQQLGTQQSPPPEPNWTLASVALLVSPFAFWGTSMVVMKGLALSPLMMGTVRLLPAGALLVAWAVMRGRPHPSGWKAWAWVLAFGLVDGAAFQGFLAEGLQRTSAGLGSVIIDSQPLTVAVLAAILFGETLSSQAVQGLVLGVLGLLLLELPEQSLADAVQALQQLGPGAAQAAGEMLPALHPAIEAAAVSSAAAPASFTGIAQDATAVLAAGGAGVAVSGCLGGAEAAVSGLSCSSQALATVALPLPADVPNITLWPPLAQQVALAGSSSTEASAALDSLAGLQEWSTPGLLQGSTSLPRVTQPAAYTVLPAGLDGAWAMLDGQSAMLQGAPTSWDGVGAVSEAVGGSMIAGSSLVSASSPPLQLPEDWASSGELWMLAAAQAMAVGTVMVRFVTRQGVDPVMATGWHMVLGGVVLLAAALLEDPHALEEAAAVLSEPVALAQATYISVLGGAAGYGIFFWQASTKQNLTALSSLTFLTPVSAIRGEQQGGDCQASVHQLSSSPAAGLVRSGPVPGAPLQVFAAVTGYFALNEVLTPPQLLGAAVTLSSVSLINSRHPSGNKPAGSASGEKQ
ncbi:hypothetical protein QJQ45_018257 [Haematococcus lacustris]|nr:hypothetical protein QJQ45_018257 [Haematococcus lacustris]